MTFSPRLSMAIDVSFALAPACACCGNGEPHVCLGALHEVHLVAEELSAADVPAMWCLHSSYTGSIAICRRISG